MTKGQIYGILNIMAPNSQEYNYRYYLENKGKKVIRKKLSRIAKETPGELVRIILERETRRKEWQMKNYKKNKEKSIKYATEWRKKNVQHVRDLQKKYRDARRESVLAYYGSLCICCGEKEIKFLCIDHINGGGNEHRREMTKNKSGNGGNIYYWLVKNNFPPGFQILCHNCNMAKGFYGECPHSKNLTKQK